MTPIKWTSKALGQVASISAYISAFNPAASRRVIARIRERVDQLSARPYISRPGRVPGTRELFVGIYQYKIVYRVSDVIEVLAVFHIAQEPDESYE